MYSDQLSWSETKGFKIDTEVSLCFSLFTLLSCFRYFRCAMLLPKIKQNISRQQTNKTFKFRRYFARVFLRTAAEERERLRNLRDYIYVRRSDSRLAEGLEPNRCKPTRSSRNPTTWQRRPYVDMSMCCSLIKRTSGRDLHAGSAVLGSLSLTSLAKKFLGGSCGGRLLGSAGPRHKRTFRILILFWSSLTAIIVTESEDCFDLAPPPPPPLFGPGTADVWSDPCWDCNTPPPAQAAQRRTW